MAKNFFRYRFSLSFCLIITLSYCLYSLVAESQVIIPYSQWRCNDLDYLSETTATNVGFNLGTYSNTNVSGNSVVLSLGQSSGTYTSKVYDIFGGCSPLKNWASLEWKTTLPYGKEIPMSDEGVLNYSVINTGLTISLVKLFHLNGSGAVVNGDTIASAVGTSGTAVNVNGTGMTYTANGKLNSALTFDGIDDYVDVAYTHTTVSAYTTSLWFKTSSSSNNVFIQDRGTGAGMSLTLGIGANPMGCAAGKISYGLDSDSIYIGKCTSGTYNDGIWHHVIGVWSGTSGAAVAASQFTIYVDGVSVATSSINVGTAPNAPLTGLGNTKIGRHDAWAVNLNGSLDEVAMWTRSLSSSDAQQVFQRGGNRLKFQLKSCALSNCSDTISWKGPNNTSATYFTEINNNYIQDTGMGHVLTSKPKMNFFNFPLLSVATNRYFQYQTTFESDNTFFQPDLVLTSIYHGCGGGSATFSTSGTWQLPVDCSTFTVTVKGGGGASAQKLGGGTSKVGGAGGLAIKTFNNQLPFTNYTISIGMGGTCQGTAGAGGYSGGEGGANTCTVGSPGLGAGTGGTGGAGSGPNAGCIGVNNGGCAGGAGKFGGAGGGGGINRGGGGGGASSFSLAGIDYVVAGGGGAAGAADYRTAGDAGAACALASGYNGGNAGAASGGTAGGGGGGGGCFCFGGPCDIDPTAGGAAGGAAATNCIPASNGSTGTITVNW